MMVRVVALLALFVGSQAAADGFECEDASAYFRYTQFASKVVKEVAGSCASNFSQPACLTYMKVIMDSEKELDSSDGANIDAFLWFLKETCPDHFPEDPTKF